MMTNRKIILCLLLFSVSSILVYSQEDDFGIWFDVQAEHEILKNLNAELSGSVRTKDNSSVVDQCFAEGGISFVFNKYLSAGSSYRLISKLENNSEYYFRHKFFLNVKGFYTAGRFDFSGRLMYQRVVQTYIEDNNDLIPQNYVRLKLKAEYIFPSSVIRPYIYFEPFVPIFNDNDFGLKKLRAAAGIEIRLSQKSSLETGYIFEDYNKAIAPDLHVLTLKYNIRF